MGLGASQRVAMDIFQGLRNSSTSDFSNSNDSMADISASINVLTVMARASQNVAFQEDVFPVSPCSLLLPLLQIMCIV